MKDQKKGGRKKKQCAIKRRTSKALNKSGWRGRGGWNEGRIKKKSRKEEDREK